MHVDKQQTYRAIVH